MTVGIDKIGFFTSNYYLDMTDLANARGEDPNKYLIGIGQQQQAVIPPTQDVVTMAANAAEKILTESDKHDIDMVIFGTETGIDNSKSAAIYVQSLLGISSRARSFEIKQACYGGTAGVQMAADHIAMHPESKVLVLAADIARYGIGTPGEVTQGGGAIAMLLSANPSILALDNQSTFHSENIMDFWRPFYKREAIVDGHYSTNIYIDFFNQTFKDYCQKYHRNLNDFAAIAYHLPFTKMGLKALRTVITEDAHSQQLLKEFDASKRYNALVGNLYTGSLYLSLLSLLANSTDLKAGDRIGLFSYGSGAQGEFYSGTISDGMHADKMADEFESVIADRVRLSVSEYEKMYADGLPTTGGDVTFDSANDPSRFIVLGRQADQLVYKDQKG
ncbi:hydroxymethylglutaryl-CoA synthase [Lentilactobacillus otakiensis]|uniref:Hydroxymethylglutaryl-CoA synthase n=1 Tax=Lentilactobacillus otakiensis DSM 19908 = JCM 15040 TaxID=1423780 RepID=S4NF99_9LACO|nr:hydroxymethylglutaryl-CoA synthase [Lentilactobacillus otakiensis]KRL09077.1 hydroxymethylglutaryl-CoA synthase [Lentilactobacillus otakiensis DSM 19908 = JCM 15040]MBZ3775692.1 hydroxymethylglutaryl-CoA synthase [Lentilactobacillus otakiensis]MDV3518911.1 hydroxymethylglutaryl-CoA synthase [Lentilactobacillus otakiensis]GAD15927.1 hydroxymethylglutaryl-CoA synthase [Lentilactobacillus otakiensis DSM 19908 = JCM 15040]